MQRYELNSVRLSLIGQSWCPFVGASAQLTGSVPGPSMSLSVLDTVISSNDKVLALSTKSLYFYTSNCVGMLGKGLLSCQNSLALPASSE